MVWFVWKDIVINNMQLNNESPMFNWSKYMVTVKVLRHVDSMSRPMSEGQMMVSIRSIVKSMAPLKNDKLYQCAQRL